MKATYRVTATGRVQTGDNTFVSRTFTFDQVLSQSFQGDVIVLGSLAFKKFFDKFGEWPVPNPHINSAIDVKFSPVEALLPDDLKSRLLALPLMSQDEANDLLADIHARTVIGDFSEPTETGSDLDDLI